MQTLLRYLDWWPYWYLIDRIQTVIKIGQNDINQYSVVHLYFNTFYVLFLDKKEIFTHDPTRS